jgi:sodium/bile acid cotransporter 7
MNVSANRNYSYLIPADAGVYLSNTPTNKICVGIIFFNSGIKLETSKMWKAIKSWKASLFGVVSILFVTPCISFLIQVIPLDDVSLKIGLIIFCCLPTTTTSGVVLTEEARGDTSLSLLFAVLCNMLGVFTVPLMLSWILSSSNLKVYMDPVPLLLKVRCLFSPSNYWPSLT